MSSVDKIAKNSLSNSAAFFVEALVAFMMMPFVIHHLGDSAYGIWVLINAMTGYLGLFKLGFRPSINKHVAEFNALGDYKSLNDFVGASLHLYLYVSVAIAVSAIGISYYFPLLFDVEEQFVEVFRIIFLFAGVQSIFALMGTAFGGVISGYQRYEINAGVEIAVIVVRAGLILYFLPIFTNLYTVAAAHFSITIAGDIITIFAARKIAPLGNMPVMTWPNKKTLHIIIKYNSISFSIAALSILISHLDSVIVGLILPLSAITHYVIGDRLVKYCNMFLKVTTKVIAPAISELNATNKQDQLNQVLLLTQKMACVVVYPILICLMIQGDEFIRLWVGDGYQQSYQVMLVLAVSSLLIAPSHTINSYLYGIGQHRYLLVMLVIEMAVSLPACYFLGTEIGLVGVAIGMSVPRAILRGIFLPLLISRFTSINVLKHFLTANLVVLAATAPFGLCLYLVREQLGLESWLLFLGQLAVAGIIYLLTVYFAVFNTTEKSEFRRLIAKMKKT